MSDRYVTTCHTLKPHGGEGSGEQVLGRDGQEDDDVAGMKQRNGEGQRTARMFNPSLPPLLLTARQGKGERVISEWENLHRVGSLCVGKGGLGKY